MQARRKLSQRIRRPIKGYRVRLNFPSTHCLLAILFFVLASCATAGPDSSQPGIREGVANGTPPTDQADVIKLADLWRQRSQEKGTSDYPFGVGDVVEISVPSNEELRARTVRVLNDGTILLSFVGKLQVAGLTEGKLQQKLVERLEEYMYSPARDRVRKGIPQPSGGGGSEPW